MVPKESKITIIIEGEETVTVTIPRVLEYNFDVQYEKEDYPAGDVIGTAVTRQNLKGVKFWLIINPLPSEGDGVFYTVARGGG